MFFRAKCWIYFSYITCTQKSWRCHILELSTYYGSHILFEVKMWGKTYIQTLIICLNSESILHVTCNPAEECSLPVWSVNKINESSLLRKWSEKTANASEQCFWILYVLHCRWEKNRKSRLVVFRKSRYLTLQWQQFCTPASELTPETIRARTSLQSCFPIKLSFSRPWCSCQQVALEK